LKEAPRRKRKERMSGDTIGSIINIKAEVNGLESFTSKKEDLMLLV
jgi:hypothetical protein